MPAISTTRRSWISPQRPRTCGWRSAFTRLPVSSRSCDLHLRHLRELLADLAVGVLARLLQRARSSRPPCRARPSPAPPARRWRAGASRDRPWRPAGIRASEALARSRNDWLLLLQRVGRERLEGVLERLLRVAQQARALLVDGRCAAAGSSSWRAQRRALRAPSSAACDARHAPCSAAPPVGWRGSRVRDALRPRIGAGARRSTRYAATTKPAMTQISAMRVTTSIGYPCAEF